MSDPQHGHRCYVKPAHWQGGDLLLEPDDAHHLLHVLRLRDGARVEVFDGEGRRGEAVLCVPDRGAGKPVRGKAAGAACRAQLLSEAPALERDILVTLIQALPKGKRMDLIVEKATELGAAVIQPVITERVVVKLDPRAEQERTERWGKIALSAARQCGTPWLPEIRPLRTYPEALACSGPCDLLLLGALTGRPEPMRDVLRKAAAAGARRIGLIVGPEGDLTPAEMEAARAHGAVPISFGKLVLRVETAAIYGLSVLAYEFAGAVGSRQWTVRLDGNVARMSESLP